MATGKYGKLLIPLFAAVYLAFAATSQPGGIQANAATVKAQNGHVDDKNGDFTLPSNVQRFVGTIKPLANGGEVLTSPVYKHPTHFAFIKFSGSSGDYVDIENISCTGLMPRIVSQGPDAIQAAITSTSPPDASTFIIGTQGNMKHTGGHGHGGGGPPPKYFWQAQATAPQVNLKSVTYSGAHFHFYNVTQDSGGVYGTPQWEDKSNPLDGNASNLGEPHFPLCYLHNATMTVAPVFITHAIPAGTPHEIKGAGTATGGVTMTFPATKATAGNGQMTVTIKSSNKLPKSIQDLNPLTIHWSYSLDGGKTWHTAGASDNRVYVIRKAPARGVTLYESVLDISCRSAVGDTAKSKTVADIWKAFVGPPHDHPVRGVKRKAVDGYNKKDGLEMTYWLPPSQNKSCSSVKDLLASKNGDGQCGAWAQLFQAALQVQGIPGVKIIEILPNPKIDPKASAFLVKTWVFGRDINTGKNGECETKAKGDDIQVRPVGAKGPKYSLAVSPGSNGTGPNNTNGNGVLDTKPMGDDQIQHGVNSGEKYPYVPGVDVTDKQGVPGQANDNPPGAFGNHFIVKYKSQYYDPSYGSGPYASALAHERASIAGVLAFPPKDNHAYPVVKKIDPNNLELLYIELK